METASFHGSKQDLELVTHSSVFKKEMNYERMRGLCFDRFLFHGMLLDTPNAIERRQSTHGPFSLRTAARKHKCTIYQPKGTRGHLEEVVGSAARHHWLAGAWARIELEARRLVSNM